MARGIGTATRLTVCAAALLAVATIAPVAASAAVMIPVDLGSQPPDAATTTRLGQRYAFDARYDTGTGSLRVSQRLNLTNRADHGITFVNLSVIPRALGSFSLFAVRVDGAVALRSWTTNTNLRVRLGRTVPPGGEATITLRYKLTPKLQTGAFSARLAREAGVSSFGEWFPIISREHDSYGVGDPQISYTADAIRLDLTTSTRLPRAAVACPGRVKAPEVRGRHWTCRVERVRDFAFAVNPDYHVVSRTVSGTIIRVHVETVGGATTLDKAARAFRRLNDLYGDYPYRDLVLAEVGGASGFSMEYPRQIHLTRSKVTDTYVIYHEVAHQWFYGLLGNHQMREPWLDEGFSDFSARYLMGVGANQCSTKNIDVSVFAFPAGLTSGGNWTECQGYFFTVFNKATAMLNQVRAAMGTADFFDAIRAHIAERRYGMTSSRALLDHLEAWDGASLAPIYRAYTKRY